MPDITAAIAQVRLFLDDTVASHRVAPDSLDDMCDGVRKVFPASNKNLVSSTVKFSADGGALTSVTPSDPVFGIVTLATAPTATLDLYYCYQYFVDADIQAFVDQGLAEMNFTEIDLATMPTALYTASAQFAAAFAYESLMGRFAKMYNVTAEGETFDKSDVYKSMKTAHDTLLTRAEKARGDYWGNQNRSNRPASATSSS